MTDLFGDAPPPPKPKRASSRPAPPTPPVVESRSVTADPLPPPPASVAETVVYLNADKPCSHRFRPPLDHQCAVGGGSAGTTRDGGKTWFCWLHLPKRAA